MNQPLLDRELACHLALAAAIEAAERVHQLASGTTIADTELAHLMNGIFTGEADNYDELFVEPHRFRPSIEIARSLLQSGPKNPFVASYLSSIIDLARRLTHNHDIARDLSGAIGQLNVEEATHADLANIYVEHIGAMGRRIQVKGRPDILQREDVAATIRALLLAGIRFAWAWLQLGGRRWHLMLRRAPILNSLNELNILLRPH